MSHHSCHNFTVCKKHVRYEKMISGLYIGELSRLALLSRAESKKIFSDNIPDLLYRENSLDGAVVSNCIRFVRLFYPTVLTRQV